MTEVTLTGRFAIDYPVEIISEPEESEPLTAATPVGIEVTPMPWHVEYGNAECGADKWAVVKDDDGALEGCHDARADAVTQLQALYASETDVLTAAAGETQTGAMIAFVPSLDDAKRMTIDGGLPAGELHVTALYLGEAANFDEMAQAKIIESAKAVAATLAGPVPANAFAISIFNPDGLEPCLVVGLSGMELAQAYDMVCEDSTLMGAAAEEMHAPWIPHITLVYDPAPEIYYEDARVALGPVNLDRLRVAFAGVVTDIPIGPTDAVIAAMVPAVIPEIQDGTPVSGVAIVEGVPDGSGRLFEPGALTWADPPMALRWPQLEQEGHSGAAIVGRIDEMWRDEVGAIRYRGVMDDEGEFGGEALRLMRKDMLRGVSPMLDDIDETDVEYLIQGGETEPHGEIYRAGRIRSLTLLSEPAFTEAFIEVGDSPDRPGPIMIEKTPATPTSIVAAGYTITIPELWPEDWFAEPDESEMPPFGAVTITASGRVIGMIAPKQVVHRAFRANGQGVMVPTRQDYSEFNNKPALVAASDGSGAAQIYVGSLTFDCGHADPFDTRRADPRWAAQHYDNACSVAARVRAGEHSRTGQPFIAGALMHGMDAEKLERMMGCAVSGDWQGGKFNAALLVPVEGFPSAVPDSARLRVKEGMVASYVPLSIERDPREDLERLARRVGLDAKSRLEALRLRVNGAVRTDL